MNEIFFCGQNGISYELTEYHIHRFLHTITCNLCTHHVHRFNNDYMTLLPKKSEKT